MAGNTGGPWGGGGGRGGGGDDDQGDLGGRNGPNGGQRPGPGGRRPEGGAQIPDIDELVRKGQDQLRVLMGGRSGTPRGTNGGGSGGTGGPGFSRGTVVLALLVGVVLWVFSSLYTVQPEEQAVELFLGDYYRTTDDGLHFAPWPFINAEVISVTTERTEEIGVGRASSQDNNGLMLTTDENIVDIDFQVVWNIGDPAMYLFNLAEPRDTIRAVSESAMREVIAQSELAPILNRDRGLIADTVESLIQTTLDSYDSGVNVLRLNLDKADPPGEVIDAFRDVQAAEQERDRLQRQADAYANRILAGARGESAQVLEEAEAYRAQVVNEAEGEASRFSAVLQEYRKAPEVTRKRLYIETMESVLGQVDKVILDSNVGGDQGVVPYLPLNELRRATGDQPPAQGGSN